MDKSTRMKILAAAIQGFIASQTSPSTISSISDAQVRAIVTNSLRVVEAFEEALS